MSGVSPHANMSSGGDAQVPPPSKKPKLDGDSAPPPAAGTHLTPAAPPPAAAHSLPMMPLMPVGTSASFPGGISLTISNGMINMQKAGGQGDGAPPHGLTVVKGDNSGSMCQLSTPVQGVLKIPTPRPLQLRMAGGRAGFKATRHPFRPAGMVTMSPRPGVPISPQAMQMMGVAPLLQAQNRPPGHMTPGQQVTAIHPLAGTVIPASSVTAKIDPNNPTNGQHSSTHKDPAKRREQLIASKPPAGTVPIGKAAVVKSVSPASSQGGAQAKSPTGPHGTQLKQVQVASSRPPHLSVVQGQPMPRVPASIPQFSVVRSQAAPLASPRPPQLSLVRTHAPSLLSPQSVGVSNAPPPPLSIIHGQPVQAMSSSAQLSLLQGQHSPMLSPQPTFVMTHHPGQGKPPGMAVMVPTSQVSLAGLKPRAPVSMVITAPSTAQPKVATSSAVEQKPASTSPAQPECVTTTGQPSAPAEPAPTQRSPDKSPAQPAQSTEPVAPDSTIEPSTPNPPDTPTTDFDPVDAMTWENGVGSLPGSELKFRMNEFGMMEMITDDPALDTSAPLEPPTSTAENAPTEPPQTSQASAHPTTIHLEFVNKDSSAGGVTNVEIKSDEVKACANCGRYCLKNKLIKSGKFCSEECFAASSEKKGDKLTMKKPVSKDAVSLKTVESKDGGSVKKKKKKLSEAVKQEPDLDILSVKVMDTVGGKKPKGFVWSHYLDQEKAAGAPTKLFKEPFPTVRNGFKVGMRCEGIDPSHQSLFCVLSVAEVKGFRLRMRFDGYSESYDFWINADNPFLFPVGWCEKNNRTLQPPRGFSSDFEFNWGGYLKFCGGSAAPKHLFINQHTTSLTPNAFRVSQKLEAVDLKNTTLICVATVADTLGERILVHFDGWEDDYDYWCDPSSPYIHPVGWCQANAKALSPPADWQDISRFTWEEYLSQTKATAVPARAFKQRPPVGFEVGMKMEVVDRRNPILIRVASIVEVLEHKVRVHFDGWSEAYDLWVDDDSPDLHPPGWCGRTGHALQAPVYPEDLIVSPGQSGCPTPGCKGFGHIKGAKYVGHHSAFGCPYSQMNMVKEVALVDRLVSSRGDDGGATLTTKAARALDRISPEQRSCPTPGCDGSGHVTGKYAAHSKSSGCPLAQQNLLLKSKAYGKDGLKFRPGRGRGRGRKKHCKFLHWREKREKEEHSPGTSPEPGVSGAGSSLHNGIHQSVFMSAMVPNPAKDLPLCWDQHSKLLPGVDKIRGGQVASWSIHDVASFVRSLPGCKELASIFIEQQIDGEAFLLLNQTDIVKIMNIKLGPALKIYNSILMFQSSTDT